MLVILVFTLIHHSAGIFGVADSHLCSNGNVPGEDCELIVSFGYRCQTAGTCERINGTQKCCARKASPCRDTSTFCRFTKSLCDVKRRETFHQLKRTCAKTCNLCEFETFEDLVESRNAPKPTECVEEPRTGLRKCVFPKEKRLTTSSPQNRLKAFALKRKESLSERDYESSGEVEIDVNGVTPTDDYELRKEKLENIMNNKETFPAIYTERPHGVTLSLAKTLIKGKCFDSYIYCREFETLCSHPTFADVMNQHCALTCDQCGPMEELANSRNETERCYDITPDCDGYKDLCNKPKYQMLMKEYCPRACEHCTPSCKDRHLNCANYANDDFCHDEAYSQDERKYLCGETCGFCQR